VIKKILDAFITEGSDGRGRATVKWRDHRGKSGITEGLSRNEARTSMSWKEKFESLSSEARFGSDFEDPRERDLNPHDFNLLIGTGTKRYPDYDPFGSDFGVGTILPSQKVDGGNAVVPPWSWGLLGILGIWLGGEILHHRTKRVFVPSHVRRLAA
jgi:hypothetical protein